jgi:hypothetical protein
MSSRRAVNAANLQPEGSPVDHNDPTREQLLHLKVVEFVDAAGRLHSSVAKSKTDVHQRLQALAQQAGQLIAAAAEFECSSNC